MMTQGRRRALGQHFLKDTSVATQIAEVALQEASRFHCTSLLEIGPGRGAITLPILDRISSFPEIRKFTLVEKDQRLFEEWKNKKIQESQASLVLEVGDFLELPKEKWLQPGPMAVVSNLPYSAGTAILNRLVEETPSICSMVLMFQAEVAKRLKAEPSTSGRGSLSVWIQNQWEVKSFLFVPPKAFSPPPEVNSEVVILTRRNAPIIDVFSNPKHLEIWGSLLKACFAHRRKMLRSSFPWPEVLERSGVDPTKRAEALEWPEWKSLFDALCSKV